MRISFDRTKAFLSNVNARSEFHGDERKSAGDLTIKLTAPGTVLETFQAGLQAGVFQDPPHKPDQVEAPLSHLRYPFVALPIKWTDEMIGGTLTVHQGLGGPSDIVLRNIKVNKWQMWPKGNGVGSVDLEFRVQAHPDETQFGVLCGRGLIQSEIEITLAPPETEEDKASPQQELLAT